MLENDFQFLQFDGRRDAKGAVAGETAIRYEDVAVGIEAEEFAEGLDSDSGAGDGIILRNGLQKRIGKTGLPPAFVVKLWLCSGVGAVAAWIVKLTMGLGHPILLAMVSLGLLTGPCHLDLTKLRRHYTLIMPDPPIHLLLVWRKSTLCQFF